MVNSIIWHSLSWMSEAPWPKLYQMYYFDLFRSVTTFRCSMLELKPGISGRISATFHILPKLRIVALRECIKCRDELVRLYSENWKLMIEPYKWIPQSIDQWKLQHKLGNNVFHLGRTNCWLRDKTRHEYHWLKILFNCIYNKTILITRF